MLSNWKVCHFLCQFRWNFVPVEVSPSGKVCTFFRRFSSRSRQKCVYQLASLSKYAKLVNIFMTCSWKAAFLLKVADFTYSPFVSLKQRSPHRTYLARIPQTLANKNDISIFCPTFALSPPGAVHCREKEKKLFQTIKLGPFCFCQPCPVGWD